MQTSALIKFDFYILPEINRIVKRLVESLAPEKAILLGSHAYGNITPDSGLELSVIMETDLSVAERKRQVSRLLRLRHMPMDILVKNPLEIQRSQHRFDPFIYEVL